MRRTRWSAVAGVALAGLLVLTACSATSGDSASAGGGSEMAEAAPPAGDGSGAAPAADEAAPGTDTQESRQVVQTGEVRMTAEDPVAAADDVAALVEGTGGRVDDRYVVTDRGEEAPASAALTVRVPAEDLTAVLTRLDEVGEVVEQQVQARDVTGTAQDLDARIRALEVSVARMEDLLARATTSTDLVTAEDALTDRQSRLEELRAQRARLAEEVALSTLVVAIDIPGGVAVTAEPQGFLDGLSSGWGALVTTLGVALVVVGVVLPWALAAGALLGLVVLVQRGWGRRGRHTTGSDAPVAPTEPGRERVDA
ncbi:hypothetical protein Cma02nite_08810 [Cellulomonas marina]|nr:hypothetical protein Cma02nite_08810 [Cellulomonas marina]